MVEEELDFHVELLPESFKIEKNSHFVHSGFSSRMKATKVWTPAQMEERARLISMKKNKNDLTQEVDGGQ